MRAKHSVRARAMRGEQARARKAKLGQSGNKLHLLQLLPH